MDQQVSIRIAEKQDAPAMVEFNQAMAFETEGKLLETSVLTEGVNAVFDDPKKGFYVVAENGSGKVIGGLMITYEWSDWRNGWFWWIQSVYVLPEGRGRTIYSRLYEFAKARARKSGDVCGFRLYVEKANSHAQRVYEKVGMEETDYLMFEEPLTIEH